MLWSAMSYLTILASIMGNTRIGSTDWVDLREEQYEVRHRYSFMSIQP